MAGRSEIDMHAAVEALIEAGYAEDGRTRTETARTGSSASPLLGHGKSGGRITTSGGRVRFAMPGTAARATVGRMTVTLYDLAGAGSTANMRSFATKDRAALREALGLPEAAPDSFPQP